MYRSDSIFFALIFVLSFPILILAQKPPPDQSATSNNLLKKVPITNAAKSSAGISKNLKVNDIVKIRDPLLLNNMGVDYAAEGRLVDAVRLLRQAVVVAPDVAGIHVNFSVILEGSGQLNESLKHAELAVQLDPTGQRTVRQLCGIQFQLKMFDDAAQCYETLTKILPDEPEAAAELGAALILSGHIDRALKVLRNLVARFPIYSKAQNSIGFALFTKKKYREAAAEFKKAVEIDPASILYRFNLGMSQALSGNKAGALSQYRAIKEKEPARARLIYQAVYRDKVVFVDKTKK